MSRTMTPADTNADVKVKTFKSCCELQNISMRKNSASIDENVAC